MTLHGRLSNMSQTYISPPPHRLLYLSVCLSLWKSQAFRRIQIIIMIFMHVSVLSRSSIHWYSQFLEWFGEYCYKRFATSVAQLSLGNKNVINKILRTIFGDCLGGVSGIFYSVYFLNTYIYINMHHSIFFRLVLMFVKYFQYFALLFVFFKANPTTFTLTGY